MGAAEPGEEEELLENWIKELEQGIKGMSEVVGVPQEAKPEPVRTIVTETEWSLYS